MVEYSWAACMAFLRRLYEVVNGDPQDMAGSTKIAEDLGYDENLCEWVVECLKRDGLVEFRGLKVKGTPGNWIAITPLGVAKVNEGQ